MAKLRGINIDRARTRLDKALNRLEAAKDKEEEASAREQVRALATRLSKGMRAQGLITTEVDMIKASATSGKVARTERAASRKAYKDFYRSDAWRKVRYQALKKYGRMCACCGARAGNGVVLHVDHIIPRSKDRSLELSIENLQILCEDCNLGKSNTDCIDYREGFSDPRDRTIKELMEYCEELQDEIAMLRMGRI